MAELPKINASPLLAPALAAGSKGCRVLSEAIGKHKDSVTQVGAKIKEHSIVKQIQDRKEIVLACLGVALILHGSHFKNLFLCTQVANVFLLERVKTKVVAAWSDVTVACEKMQADAPIGKDAKKNDAQADVAVARKTLKALDSEKLSSAGVEVLLGAMACVLVMHGGLAQHAAVAYFVVSSIGDRMDAVLVFPEHEDIQAWTHKLGRFALWVVVLPSALIFGPLALALNTSMCGAHLVAKKGGFSLAKIAPDSQQGLLFTGALVAFGTLWQLWSAASGSGVAWYFQLVYLPAVLAESLLGFV